MILSSCKNQLFPSNDTWGKTWLLLFQANVQLQTLEEERIAKMNDFLHQYNSHLSTLGPKLIEVRELLSG